MSTLSGIAAKGEKGKSKFQSLDINNLYRASRGESLETHQLKNTSSRRHGMQTLGKVPSARRAPANLPSLKSEYSGNDPAVSLVPSGGTGWGSKPGETGPPPTVTQTPTSTTTTVPSASVTSTPPATVTVTTTAPAITAPTSTTATPITAPTQSHSDKSWSSITSSGSETTPVFLAHQSPYFQQEFPSLSGDANGTSTCGPNKTESSHLPGPSLRPQTEGSWMQGGSRPQGQMAAGVGSQQGIAPVPGPHLSQGLDVSGGRNNLVPSGVAAGPVGPIPPTGMPPHHYRLMPQFMIRHNHPSGGFAPNYQHGPSRPRFPYPPDSRLTTPNRGPSNLEHEEISRPIIKEEDLKVMDEIARDTGWAAHDEIDYNQTLSFSDEEGAQDDESKVKIRQTCQSMDKKDGDNRSKLDKETEVEEKLKRESSRDSVISSQNDNRDLTRAWQQPWAADSRQAPTGVNFPPQPVRLPGHQTGRQGEEEDVWRERRRLQNEEIAIAVERAKQRKEEEEKRYEETRQAATRKLQMLEEKMRSKTGVDKEDNSVLPTVQHGSNVLLPDWEKEKDKNRSRTNSEEKDEKTSKEHVDYFRSNQVDSRGGFGRERERERDRELRPERESLGQPFSRQFQSNLPPRFQKHAVERTTPYYRQSSGGSPQPPHDTRWPVGQATSHFGGSAGATKNLRNRNDSDLSERDREDLKVTSRDRNSSDSGYDIRDRERFNRSTRDNRERNETNWKSITYNDETNHKISLDNEPRPEYEDQLFDKPQEHDECKKDRDNRLLDGGKEKEDSVNNIKTQNVQDDIFSARDLFDSKVEIEKRDSPPKLEHRDRPERPQRPDSRDSRTSKDSRNSRDSIREEKVTEEIPVNRAPTLSWTDTSYDVDHKEDKRRKDTREDRDGWRDSHVMSFHQRHIPGPITKEKLEASELKCESTRNLNLVPLVRTDKKNEVKKGDNQWDMGVGCSGGDAWQSVSVSSSLAVSTKSESWADLTSSPIQQQDQSSEVARPEQTESQQATAESEEVSKTASKTLHEREDVEAQHRSDSRDKTMIRGGNRGMRHDLRGARQNWGNSYYRGGPMWRGGENRGRRASHRRSNMGRDWAAHSESEASADEVSASTESGKEDKRQEQDRNKFPRSPKQGAKKTDKDDRPRDACRKVENDDSYSVISDNRRYEKKGMYENNRMGSGFEPRGEPSRRGRGAPFRSKGSAANVGRRMDGYGPPTSKKPFTSESATNVNEDKKVDTVSQHQVLNKPDILSKLSHDNKVKLNQQQLSAGIIGSASRPGNFKPQSPSVPPRLRRKSEGERRERKSRDGSRRRPKESLKSGSGSGGEVGDENWETTSETSEHEEKYDNDDKQSDSRRNNNHVVNPRAQSRRQSQGNRSITAREKRSGGSYDRERDHNSRRSGNSGTQSIVNGNTRAQGNKSSGIGREHVDTKAAEQLADKKQPRLDNKEKRNNLDRIDLCNTASVVVIDDQPEVTVEEDQTVFATDNNGFQEVRSKKNVKENRQLKEEPQKNMKERSKSNKPPSSQSPGPTVPSTITTNKGLYERPRPGKLPPRFAKLRETSRLQKMQQQQTQEISDMNKINQGGVSMFPVKDVTNPAPPPAVNAWEKPITAALRTATPPAPPISGVAVSSMTDLCNVEVTENPHSATSSQRSSPSGDKSVTKLQREAEKTVLDGTSPPVQTIIFENTNFKSAPVDVAMKSKYASQINKNQRTEKSRERKLEEDNVALGFKSPGPEMKLQDNKADPIQMPISFNKNEDSADMKLDFRFDSELSQLTEDKASKSITAIQMTRSIQMAAQSSTAELQFKLASVKKVWENPSTGLEHSGEESGTVSTATSFTPTFGNSVEDSSTYGKTGVSVVDPNGVDDGSALSAEAVYNSSQQLQNNTNTYNGTTVQNMIKPDPSSNVCKVKPQPQATMHPHSGPLSPASGAFNSTPAQPSQHISYQPPAQYGGMSAIPSPPTVFTPQGELYPTFQINNHQVLGNQGRSQFSQFASPYISQSLGQTSGFSQQSMYLHQTAPPPPSAAPPDMFQTQLSQYRIQPPAYGTSQQLNNNPNQVLISSSTNSLMSANVKPSPQPIGAIGSKGGSYQTPSQPPPSQLYIYPEPQLLNQSPFIQSSHLVQRPANNVVPTIPPSSASYYSASTGGGATGFYQPGSSNIQAAAAAQNIHQTTFSMQAFNTQSPAATPAGMGSFGSTLPRLILQNPVPTAVGVGVVGNRVPPTVHRSNSPAQPRTTTSSPRINKMSHRQPSS